MSKAGDVVRKKLVVVGDGACGKTCLLIVFQGSEFPSVSCPSPILLLHGLLAHGAPPPCALTSHTRVALPVAKASATDYMYTPPLRPHTHFGMGVLVCCSSRIILILDPAVCLVCM